MLSNSGTVMAFVRPSYGTILVRLAPVSNTMSISSTQLHMEERRMPFVLSIWVKEANKEWYVIRILHTVQCLKLLWTQQLKLSSVVRMKKRNESVTTRYAIT